MMISPVYTLLSLSTHYSPEEYPAHTFREVNNDIDTANNRDIITVMHSTRANRNNGERNTNGDYYPRIKADLLQADLKSINSLMKDGPIHSIASVYRLNKNNRSCLLSRYPAILPLPSEQSLIVCTNSESSESILLDCYASQQSMEDKSTNHVDCDEISTLHNNLGSVCPSDIYISGDRLCLLDLQTKAVKVYSIQMATLLYTSILKCKATYKAENEVKYCNNLKGIGNKVYFLGAGQGSEGVWTLCSLHLVSLQLIPHQIEALGDLEDFDIDPVHNTVYTISSDGLLSRLIPFGTQLNLDHQYNILVRSHKHRHDIKLEKDSLDKMKKSKKLDAYIGPTVSRFKIPVQTEEITENKPTAGKVHRGFTAVAVCNEYILVGAAQLYILSKATFEPAKISGGSLTVDIGAVVAELQSIRVFNVTLHNYEPSTVIACIFPKGLVKLFHLTNSIHEVDQKTKQTIPKVVKFDKIFPSGKNSRIPERIVL